MRRDHLQDMIYCKSLFRFYLKKQDFIIYIRDLKSSSKCKFIYYYFFLFYIDINI